MAETHSTVTYRNVPDFPGYRVGDDGSVWTIRLRRSPNKVTDSWRRMVPHVRKSGYAWVTLRNNKRGFSFAVHRLVLSVFVGPCPEGREAAHGNGVRADNRLSNLRWATKLENAEDKRKHGTMCRGETGGRSRLSDQDVIAIRRLHRTGAGGYDRLAKRFGVAKPTIKHIVRGNTWKHLA